MKTLAGICLASFLGAMFVGLFFMSAGMHLSGDMSDCPFMFHEEVWCPMNLADHISAWQSVFQEVIPGAITILLSVGIVVLAIAQAPNKLLPLQYIPTRISLQHVRERIYSFLSRPLQELFSNGILHPKLF